MGAGTDARGGERLGPLILLTTWEGGVQLRRAPLMYRGLQLYVFFLNFLLLAS